MQRVDFAVGLLVYNPYDDPFHLERITKAIASIIRALNNSNKTGYLLVLLNNSKTPDAGHIGVGFKTKRVVYELAKGSTFCQVEECSYVNSMNVKGYVLLMEMLGKLLNYKYITIFADDYIVPINWFDTVATEFDKNKNLDFVLPSTCFVAQQNLIFPVSIQRNWIANKVDNGILGIDSGVEFQDVDRIARFSKHFPSIPYFPPCTFETAVFTSDVIKSVGYPCEDYYSILYNTDFYESIVDKQFVGIISRKSFVFHHGKGATRVVHKNGDEKYAGSPVEQRLMADIDLYNSRRGKNLKQWWSSSSKKPVYITKKSIVYEFYLVLKYGIRKFFK